MCIIVYISTYIDKNKPQTKTNNICNLLQDICCVKSDRIIVTCIIKYFFNSHTIKANSYILGLLILVGFIHMLWLFPVKTGLPYKSRQVEVSHPKSHKDRMETRSAFPMPLHAFHFSMFRDVRSYLTELWNWGKGK